MLVEWVSSNEHPPAVLCYSTLDYVFDLGLFLVAVQFTCCVVALRVRGGFAR